MQEGAYLGAKLETPDQLVEPDVLDGGDGFEGAGGGGLASGAQSVTG